MVHFVDPVVEDARRLSWNLREEDLVEAVLLSGALPQGVLPAGLRASSKAYTIFDDDGDLLAMCGAVGGPEEDLGNAWFLATPEIESNSKALLRESPKYLDIMSAPYPQGLYALLWEGNPMHLRWAKAVGFRVVGTQDIRGNTFYFIRRPR